MTRSNRYTAKSQKTSLGHEIFKLQRHVWCHMKAKDVRRAFQYQTFQQTVELESEGGSKLTQVNPRNQYYAAKKLCQSMAMAIQIDVHLLLTLP